MLVYIDIVINSPLNRLVSAYEDKVLADPESERIYYDLVQRYDNISFVRFADYVLEEATKHGCFEGPRKCEVNYHFR